MEFGSCANGSRLVLASDSGVSSRLLDPLGSVASGDLDRQRTFSVRRLDPPPYSGGFAELNLSPLGFVSSGVFS